MLESVLCSRVRICPVKWESVSSFAVLGLSRWKISIFPYSLEKQVRTILWPSIRIFLSTIASSGNILFGRKDVDLVILDSDFCREYSAFRTTEVDFSDVSILLNSYISDDDIGYIDLSYIGHESYIAEAF